MRPSQPSVAARAARALVKAPIHAYRWTLKPLVGWECRHLPTCSEYALDAIDRNGAWRGSWLALSRICRCHPLGTSGYDPVPDITGAHHPLAPWRYGRWRWRRAEEEAHVQRRDIPARAGRGQP